MAQTSLNRSDLVPTNILQGGKMSKTSDALTCFSQLQFSQKLQGYLVNYVISVSNVQSVYIR